MPALKGMVSEAVIDEEPTWEPPLCGD